MKKMSPAKRRQVLLILLVTGGVLAGLWFSLVSAQNRGLVELDRSIKAMEDKLHTTRKTLQGAAQLETELTAASTQLEQLEEDMASGDLYACLINRIRAFRQTHQVDIPQFGNIAEGENTLLPQFPYRQVTLNISGTAFYHDLGQFVADFENEFPYARIQNLELEPALLLMKADRERLSFRMDIIMHVKPSTT